MAVMIPVHSASDTVTMIGAEMKSERRSPRAGRAADAGATLDSGPRTATAPPWIDD